MRLRSGGVSIGSLAQPRAGFYRTPPAPTPLERGGVAAAAALWLFLVYFRRGTLIFPFASGSNGVFLDEGARLLGGEVMYRDFFEFLMPGTAYLDAVLFALAGPSVTALGAGLVLQGALLASLVHALAGRIVGWPWRLLPPAAFTALVHAPYTLGDHKWPALGAGLVGLLALCAAPLSGRRAFAGGLALGGSVFFTQDLGLGLVCGSLVALGALRPSRRVWLCAALGACGVPALALGYFAWKAGLANVVDAWLVFPLTRYTEFNRFPVGIGREPRTLPRELAQLALGFGGVAAAWLGWRRSDAPAARLSAAAGLGVLAATLHRGLYPAVLAVESSLLLPLLALALHDRPRAGWRAWPARVALALVGVGLLHAGLGLPAWRQFLQPLSLESHRAGEVWATTPLPELAWIERHTAPGEAVFLLPARGGHYFLTRTRNATSFPYLIEGQSRPEHAAQALAEIEAARPRVGLWDERPGGAAPAAGPVLTPLREGLLRLYSAERLGNGVLLLSRREAAASDASARAAPRAEAPRGERARMVEPETDAAPGVIQETELAPQLDAPRHVLALTVRLQGRQHQPVQEQAQWPAEQPPCDRGALGGSGFREQQKELAQRAVERANGLPGASALGRGRERRGGGFQHQPQVHVTDERHRELVHRHGQRVVGERVGVLQASGARRPRGQRDAPRPDRFVVDPMARALDEAVVDLHRHVAQHQGALVVGGDARGGAAGEAGLHAAARQALDHGVDPLARHQQVEVPHRPQLGTRIEPAAVVRALEQDDGLPLEDARQVRRGPLEDLGAALVQPPPGLLPLEGGADASRQPGVVEQQRDQSFGIGLLDEACRGLGALRRPAPPARQAVDERPERGRQPHADLQSTIAGRRR
jgi:hypothetical protein